MGAEVAAEKLACGTDNSKLTRCRLLARLMARQWRLVARGRRLVWRGWRRLKQCLTDESSPGEAAATHSSSSAGEGHGAGEALWGG